MTEPHGAYSITVWMDGASDDQIDSLFESIGDLAHEQAALLGYDGSVMGARTPGPDPRHGHHDCPDGPDAHEDFCLNGRQE